MGAGAGRHDFGDIQVGMGMKTKQFNDVLIQAADNGIVVRLGSHPDDYAKMRTILSKEDTLVFTDPAEFFEWFTGYAVELDIGERVLQLERERDALLAEDNVAP